MGRITSYPETTELGASDIFLVDGSNGTRKVSAPNAASEFAKLDAESYLLTARLNGAGFDAVKPPSNANLNTVDYIHQGRYYCDDDEVVATYQNCPTTEPFMMEVISPISPNVDDETTGVWVYRLRKILTISGRIFFQYVYSQDTAGIFTYGYWDEVVTSASGNLMRPEMIVIDHITTIAGDFASIGNWINSNYVSGRTISALVSPTSSGYFETAPFEIRATMVSANMGWAMLISPGTNGNRVVFGTKSGSWTWYTVPLTNVTDDNTSKVQKATYNNTSVKNGECVCRRQGNVVSINAVGDCVSLTANTVTDWVTIDSKFRPKEPIYVAVANGGVNGRYAIINTNGKIQLFSTSAFSSPNAFAISTSFIVD